MNFSNCPLCNNPLQFQKIVFNRFTCNCSNFNIVCTDFIIEYCYFNTNLYRVFIDFLHKTTDLTVVNEGFFNPSINSICYFNLSNDFKDLNSQIEDLLLLS